MSQVDQLPLVLPPVAELAELARRAPRLPALGLNPAESYIANLAPGASRRSMTNALRRVVAILLPSFASLHGDDAWRVFPWAELRRDHLLVLREKLRESFKRRTANLYLQAVRGVLTQALEQGAISGDDYQRTRTVKQVKGDELPAGRALERGEIAELVTALPSGPVGARDAALLALLYGGAVRRA